MRVYRDINPGLDPLEHDVAAADNRYHLALASRLPNDKNITSSRYGSFVSDPASQHARGPWTPKNAADGPIATLKASSKAKIRNCSRQADLCA